MRKSNIILLIAFAFAFILLGFTRTTLYNKFRNNDVKTITWEKHRAVDQPGTHRGELPTGYFRHIVFKGAHDRIDRLIVMDSVITGRDGQPAGFIEYYVKNDFKSDHDLQLQTKGDTLYFDVDNIQMLTIYTNNLRSVSAESEDWTRYVYIESIQADTMSLYAGKGGQIILSGCSFGVLDVTSGFTGFVNCFESTKIDTLDLSIEFGGKLRLSNFTGFVRRTSIDRYGELTLEGSSIKAFANVQWNQ